MANGQSSSVTISIHRCRFVDTKPSHVTALAFPPLPLPSNKSEKPESFRRPLEYGTLAAGHANGNIDLCEWAGSQPQQPAPQAWVIYKTLPGPINSRVDCLSFAIRYPEDLSPGDVPSRSQLRLFSSGGSNELIEWDLERGCVKRTVNSHGGPIWSLAVNPASTMLALGCEDGSIQLISLMHNTFTHHRRLDRVKCRLLSVAWGPPVIQNVSDEKDQDLMDEDEESSQETDHEDWTDQWLVAGCSDSSLRKWDVVTGRVLERMSTDKIRGEQTLVWTVGVIGNGTIISGDSLGTVKFWDSQTSTLLQSFQAHGADVLCLTIGPHGTTVYSASVDQKVSQFSIIRQSESSPSSCRWVHSCSRKLHVHDIRAIASWPPYTVLPTAQKRRFSADVVPVLASGGLDMSVVLTPAAPSVSTVMSKLVNPLATSLTVTFEESYQRKLAWTNGPSGTTVVKIAQAARFVLAMGDKDLGLWRLKERVMQGLNDEAEAENNGGWDKVLELDLNVQTNLIASAISDDGRWLVVSDLYETKLFALESQVDGDVKPKRIRDFTAILRPHLPSEDKGTGGSAFTFSPDGTKLIMCTCMTSYVLLIELGSGEQKPQVLRRFGNHRSRNAFGERVVDQPDDGFGPIGLDHDNSESASIANVLRVAISADGQWLATSDDLCRTHVFNLDSMQHICALPSSPKPAHAVAFDPLRPNILILGFVDNSLLVYDVEHRQFPKWSVALCSSLPKRFTGVHDPIMGVTFDPTSSAVAADSLSEAPQSRWALFWGATWICKVPFEGAYHSGSTHRKRKSHSRQRGDMAEMGEPKHDGFRMITHYRSLLGVDFLSNGELVVVERPLVDVLGGLPPPYFRYKYSET